jgi:hypothetical protein
MSLALAILTLGLGLGAAARRDTIELRHAAARRGCTQEDFPALELLLSEDRYDDATQEPAVPYVRVEVTWNAWHRIDGQPLALVALSHRPADRTEPFARAEWHGARGAPTLWLRGTIRLRRVEIGRRVVGVYSFQGPAGKRISGRFTAPWVTDRGGCG